MNPKRMASARWCLAACFVIVSAPSIGKACELLKLGRLSPGDSMQKVIQEYGLPASRSKGGGFIVETHQYRDVSVSFDEDGTVVHVTAKSSHACDHNNICIGSPWQDAVRQVQGTHIKAEPDLITQFGDSCWMSIGRRDEVVGSIVLNCQP